MTRDQMAFSKIFRDRRALAKWSHSLTILAISFFLELQVRAVAPALYITGLPCPGGQGEPNSAHPLVWQCRCAYDAARFHSWLGWQQTVPIDYGDVVAATWYDQCKLHWTDWNFAR